MLNLSQLFSSSEHECFVDALDLKAADKDSIARAKQAIREQLRDRLPEELLRTGNKAVQPRFFTQGSWAYRTLNAPAQAPQQVDIDDGAYLPLSNMEDTGRPSEASEIFFGAAEAALVPLVLERQWTLVTSKPVCIRIVIAHNAHVDIPLYAIPDLEFRTLEKAASQRRASIGEAIVMDDADTWSALPPNCVLLANRQTDWQKSDPRPIKRWFLDQVARHGEQLRRSVRYLKAFRDWQWAAGGPASVLLMVAAAPLFEKHSARDDLALLHVAKELPRALRNGVRNPTDPTEQPLTDRLGRAGVEQAAQKLEGLADALARAVHESRPDVACDILVEQFGSRFPTDTSRIVVATPAATVSAAQAAVVASPLVGRRQAG